MSNLNCGSEGIKQENPFSGGRGLSSPTRVFLVPEPAWKRLVLWGLGPLPALSPHPEGPLALPLRCCPPLHPTSFGGYRYIRNRQAWSLGDGGSSKPPPPGPPGHCLESDTLCDDAPGAKLGARCPPSPTSPRGLTITDVTAPTHCAWKTQGLTHISSPGKRDLLLLKPRMGQGCCTANAPAPRRAHADTVKHACARFAGACVQAWREVA